LNKRREEIDLDTKPVNSKRVSDLRPLKIFILDDDKSTVLFIESIITRSNVESLIYSAGNGAAALDLIKSNQFDIAFIDIWLPDMNGLEILDKLKKTNRDTVCHVISSQSDNSYIKKARKLGIEQYLLKPFNSDQILHIIDNFYSKLGAEIS